MRRWEQKLIFELTQINGEPHGHYFMSTINCTEHKKCRIKEYQIAGGPAGLGDCECRVHTYQTPKPKSYKRQLLEALEGVI